MKILQQLLIILAFTFSGKFLQLALHLPIPGSVIGMLLLLIALMTGWLKEEKIALVGDYLLEILSVFFIPAGVGLMMHFDLVKDSLVPLVLILVVSFICSLFIVGRVSQAIIKKKKVKEKEEDPAC